MVDSGWFDGWFWLVLAGSGWFAVWFDGWFGWFAGWFWLVWRLVLVGLVVCTGWFYGGYWLI